MKNITNAYLVLSVSDIRAMLHAAELEQKVRGESRESISIVLRNIVVTFDEGDKPQISDWSVMAAVDTCVAESNIALDSRGAESITFNDSDAAI